MVGVRYTKFETSLKEIRSWINEPLEFEKNLFGHFFPNAESMLEIGAHVSLHKLLEKCWMFLDKHGDYPNMIYPIDFPSRIFC